MEINVSSSQPPNLSSLPIRMRHLETYFRKIKVVKHLPRAHFRMQFPLLFTSILSGFILRHVVRGPSEHLKL